MSQVAHFETIRSLETYDLRRGFQRYMLTIVQNNFTADGLTRATFLNYFRTHIRPKKIVHGMSMSLK